MNIETAGRRLLEGLARTVIQMQPWCERCTKAVFAGHVEDGLSCVHKRIGSLKRCQWARDDLIL
jgi:hypothetical protein